MPRSPRVDPPPLEEFEFYDDEGCLVEVEIRDETCVIKTRGYVNREKFSNKLWKIMEKVIPSYVDRNGKKTVPARRDYLSSATAFANQVVKWGLHCSGDTTELRKVYYPKVKKELAVFVNAVEAKNNSL